MVDDDLMVASNQSVPLLMDFLRLAVNSGSIILFDFKELPDNHPHALNLVNATLKAIGEAGMLHEHVSSASARSIVHVCMFMHDRSLRLQYGTMSVICNALFSDNLWKCSILLCWVLTRAMLILTVVFITTYALHLCVH